MSTLMQIHTSPLDAHFHWEYQILVLITIAGLWLFLAGRTERRRRDTDGRSRQGLPADRGPTAPSDVD